MINRPVHWIKQFNLCIFYIGGGIAILVIILTVIDVIGRYFSHPLPGTLENTQALMATMVALTLAHTQAEKGHILMDIALPVSHRAQNIIDIITSLLGLIIVMLIAWWAFFFAMDARVEYTNILRIPIFPFKFCISLGALGYSLQIILDMVESYKQSRSH